MQNVENGAQNNSRANGKKEISKIIISGSMLALAVMMEAISKAIPFFSWPMGGSVSLTMIPLILVGLYCGPVYGTLISMTFGALNFLMDGVISWTPNSLAVVLSLILDYLVGFGVCGTSSLFRKQFFDKKVYAIVLAVVLSGVLRFVSSFFSGMIVFTQGFDYESTSGLAVDFTLGGFTYSFVYNIGYMLPSIILDIICGLILLRALYTTFNTTLVKPLIPSDVKTGGFVLPSFDKLLPFVLIIDAIIGIVASIPALKISYFGYFGLILTISILAYEIVKMVKEKKIDYLYLSLTLCALAVNLLGILSPYTYGQNAYQG